MMKRLKYYLGRNELCFVLHALFLIAILVTYTLRSYENSVLDTVVESAIEPEMDEQQKALAILHITHQLLEPRLKLIKKKTIKQKLPPLSRWITSPTLRHLRTPFGVCGSFAHVLTRLLHRANIEARLAQMRCPTSEKPWEREPWDCHIYTEAKVDGKWVVLDGLYDMSFQTNNRTLASFQELNKNWDQYKDQVPANHNPRYRYEGVRYTNWTKIPIFMPALKSILLTVFGDRVESLSLRSYVLNIHSVYLAFLLLLYIPFFFLTWFVYRHPSKHAAS